MKLGIWVKTLVVAILATLSIRGAVNLHAIPNGIPDGRPEVPREAYDTVLTGIADLYLSDFKFLESKMYGIGSLPLHDNLKRAEYVFHLEHALVGLFQQVVNDSRLSTFEWDVLTTRGHRIFLHLRTEGERGYEAMIRIVDVALPGPNGGQIRVTDANGIARYFSNCRSETIPTPTDQFNFFERKRADFLAAGGSLSEMFPLDAAQFANLPTPVRLEYVVREDRSLWVTQGTAGHVLLAEGGPVLAAGQLLLIRNNNGGFEFAVISNASGTYKPDISSTQIVEDKLIQLLGQPNLPFISTKGEFLGTQTVKVLMKAAGVAKTEIDTKIKEMRQDAIELLTSPKLFLPNFKSCLGDLRLLGK